MHFPRLLTFLALLGFSACTGTEPAAPEPEPAPAPAPAPAPEPDPYDAFAASKYSYCDAALIANTWDYTHSAEDAKLYIGKMLVRGQEAALPDKLLAGRAYALAHMDEPGSRCRYTDIGYTYDDAALLSEFWGISAEEAKVRIEEKYLRDGQQKTHIDAVILEARAQLGGAVGSRDPYQAFAQSTYGYCDAKVLASYWGKNLDEAKFKIGQRLMAGMGVIDDLQTAQRVAIDPDGPVQRCSYEELGYSYQDTDLLAAYWGISTWDAKMRIEEKFLRDGHQKTHIDEALQAARSSPQ